MLKQYNLPKPIFKQEVEDKNLLLAQESFNYTTKQVLFNKSLLLLNSRQYTIYNQIINAINNYPRQAYFFLQGPARTSKTFLYRVLYNYYQARRDIILYVTLFRIATQLLPSSRTSHSRFKILLLATKTSKCHMLRQSQLAKLIYKTRLIIQDKVLI